MNKQKQNEKIKIYWDCSDNLGGESYKYFKQYYAAVRENDAIIIAAIRTFHCDPEKDLINKMIELKWIDSINQFKELPHIKRCDFFKFYSDKLTINARYIKLKRYCK
jgi:hypothetical protein